MSYNQFSLTTEEYRLAMFCIKEFAINRIDTDSGEGRLTSEEI
jgi:hypothetical protein